MVILVLDSSSGTCSAALGNERGLRAILTEPRSAMQAERLLPLIEALLQQEGVKYRDLDAVAVSIGPGSFTGIRIGLATARGLALAADIPLIGVTTLEAAAYEALNRHDGVDIRQIAALLDARRGQCYAQHFMRDAVGNITSGPPRLLDYGAADGFIATAELIVTDHAARIADSAPCPVVEIAMTAAHILPVAMTKSPDRERQAIRPLYIRPPDAKLPTAFFPAISVHG